MIILMVGAIPYAVSKISKTENDMRAIARQVGANFDMLATSGVENTTIEIGCPKNAHILIYWNEITVFRDDFYTQGGNNYYFMYEKRGEFFYCCEIAPAPAAEYKWKNSPCWPHNEVECPLTCDQKCKEAGYSEGEMEVIYISQGEWQEKHKEGATFFRIEEETIDVGVETRKEICMCKVILPQTEVAIDCDTEDKIIIKKEKGVISVAAE